MRFIKWTLFFVVSFFISWIVLSTFSQAPFRAAVPVRIVFYTTRDIPIYYFIAIAFTLGLCIGLAIAIYNFIALKTQGMRLNRRIRDLEAQVPQNYDETDGNEDRGRDDNAGYDIPAPSSPGVNSRE